MEDHNAKYQKLENPNRESLLVFDIEDGKSVPYSYNKS